MIKLSATSPEGLKPIPGDIHTIRIPVFSDWECHPFGEGVSFRPLRDKEPNRFHRWMQYLVFGVKWRKRKC